MKILYGVVGEGMGHAMRFEGVNRIHGLHMIYDENRVRLGKTLWSNVLVRSQPREVFSGRQPRDLRPRSMASSTRPRPA